MNCTRGLFMVRSIVLRVFDPTLESSSFTLIKDSTLEELPMLLEQPFNTANKLEYY